MECPEVINEIHQWYMSNVSFKTCVSLLIFHFHDLSISISGVLKLPTTIVLLSISLVMSVSVCFMIEVLLCWVHKSENESESHSVDWHFATPWTVENPPGILQARILEWVAFPFSRGSSQPRGWSQVSCIEGRFFTSWTRYLQLLGLPFGLISWSLYSVLPYLL